MFMTRSSKRKCDIEKCSEKIRSFKENSLRLFAGYLWLHRPHKNHKWKRYYTCLYTSPSLTFLAWWSNRNEAQLRGFLSLTDYNVKCSLADSFLIIPTSPFSQQAQICFSAENTKDKVQWLSHLREHSALKPHRTFSNSSCDTSNRSSCYDTDDECSGLTPQETEGVQWIIDWTYRLNGLVQSDSQKKRLLF